MPVDISLDCFLPGAEHLIAYPVITEGRCFTDILGEEPFMLEAGEVIVFTKGTRMSCRALPACGDPLRPDALDGITGSQLPFFTNYGSDGPTSAKFVCGFLACDAQPFNPLLYNLPQRLEEQFYQWKDVWAVGLMQKLGIGLRRGTKMSQRCRPFAQSDSLSMVTSIPFHTPSATGPPGVDG
jgi:hypothetical protein